MNVDRISAALQSRSPRDLLGISYRPAAVLMPIQFGPEGARFVLTQRAQGLSYHRGQVAFPGGRIDPADGGPLAAALRESQEEIGLDPADVRVLGRLDQVPAAADFVVTPFVGAIPAPYRFRLNPNETEAVFTVPIAALLEPERLKIADRLSAHGQPIYHFYIDGWDIWGATARMIAQFLELVCGYRVAPQ
ncbi:MAG TPA: CoA pyrophosphatase [Candidatus Eisenbacteria bacterium]|nr:CoA pyrophosphatase [Candidatus Eisenbacteria bacterium]